MSDLISRADAIEALESNKSDWNNDYNKPIDNDIKAIESLPSADRPSGEWLMFDGLYCSNCHYKLQTTGIPTYCPSCGARMTPYREDGEA